MFRRIPVAMSENPLRPGETSKFNMAFDDVEKMCPKYRRRTVLFLISHCLQVLFQITCNAAHTSALLIHSFQANQLPTPPEYLICQPISR